MAGEEVNVGLLGCGFMGKAHSFGYRNVNEIWSPPRKAVMKCIAGTEPEEVVKETAAQHGWDEYATDWKEVVQRDDIDLIDLSTPNFAHEEEAIAAANAGKHILSEKPLTTDLESAKKMWDAVKQNNVLAMCGFTYRQAPAV